MSDEVIIAGRLATLEADMKHMTKQQDIILGKVSSIEKILGNLLCNVHEEKLMKIEDDYATMKKDMIHVLRFKERLTGKFAGIAAVIFILLQVVNLFHGWAG